MIFRTLNGPFNDEMVEKFALSLDGCQEPLKIYITSNGGCVSTYRALIDIINNYPNDDVTVQAIETCDSAAAMFFLFSRSKKEYTLGTEFTLHTITSYLESRQLEAGNEDILELQKTLSRENKEILETLKEVGLSEKGLQKIKEGKDYVLRGEELAKVCQNAFTTFYHPHCVAFDTYEGVIDFYESRIKKFETKKKKPAKKAAKKTSKRGK